MEGISGFFKDGYKFSASRALLIWLDTVGLIGLTTLAVMGEIPFGEVVKLLLGLNATLCTVYAVNTYRKNGESNG